MKHQLSRRLATLSLLFIAPAVYAHPEGVAGGGLASGFSHPFMGLDHMLAMVAVGLWAAQLGGSALWKVPSAFVLTMVLGCVLSFTGLVLPIMEPMIISSLLVLGLLIAFKATTVPVIASIVVAVFALFHGYAHGVELPQATSPYGYAIGFVTATAMLHGIGIASGLISKQAQILVRGAGVAIAGAGVAMFFM